MEAGLETISSLEISEWQAYARLYGPINPQERADLRMARLAAVIANLFRGKDTKPIEEKEYLFDFSSTDEAEEGQSVEHMIFIVEQLNAALGGEDLRK